jgi:hypothetical protein
MVEVQADWLATAAAAMQVCRTQGLVDADDNFTAGGCLLLPATTPGIVSLLLVTPCPADLHGPDLQPRPSPVRFERTDDGRLILAARWLAARARGCGE